MKPLKIAISDAKNLRIDTGITCLCRIVARMIFDFLMKMGALAFCKLLVCSDMTGMSRFIFRMTRIYKRQFISPNILAFNYVYVMEGAF